MIAQEHPIVEKLAALRYKFELIGSRMYAFDRNYPSRSDYDFMCSREGSYLDSLAMIKTIEELGFVKQDKRITTYEEDGGIEVWRWEDKNTTLSERIQSIDILVLYSKEEYDRRMRIHRLFRDVRLNKLYEALHNKPSAWCDLFALIHRLEKS